MKYSKEFKALLDNMRHGYVGHGNPNAEILLMGQESAIDPKTNAEQYAAEVEGNAEQWRVIVSNGIGYETVDHIKIEYGLPLHPWANQKFQVRNEIQANKFRGEKGTARTWYNYQKLINRIFELYSEERKPMTKDDFLDFHRLSFHSDMSAVASKKHDAKNEVAVRSVLERVSLFSNDFFRSFPIVIAAVGHFPRDTYGDGYFGDVFGVEFLGNEEIESGKWINVSIRKDDARPMLLIHTPQFSAAISDRYLDQIAKRVVDFAREHKINLFPEE